MATTKETTFRSFTPEQAAAYASGRGDSYPEPLYQTILDFHSGAKETVLDVGTGPGKAVWDLLRYFDKAIGCDTSPEMVGRAKQDAVARGVAHRSTFFIVGGEDCASTLSNLNDEDKEEKMDAITAAMAAHWFSLPDFYTQAAQLLRPGGTLAMWTCSSFHVHPSVPRHESLQRILSHLEDELLGPYMLPGNILAGNAYEDLALPWDNSNTPALFDKSSFKRVDWDWYGVPSAPPRGTDRTPGLFLFGKKTMLEEMEAGFDSASAVIRWREANLEISGTEEGDPVQVTMRDLRDVVDRGRDSGSRSDEWWDGRLFCAPSCSLLLMRRA
jgi:trans-aconitate 3-methyltransferase